MKIFYGSLLALLLTACGFDSDFYLVADHAEGIKKGSVFTVSGIEAGEVTEVELTSENRVRIGIHVNEDIKLPDDTEFARITTSIWGGQSIDALPGRSRNMIAAGDELEMSTNSSGLFKGAERMLKDAVDMFADPALADSIKAGIEELKRSGVGDSIIRALREGSLEIEKVVNDEELREKIRTEMEKARKELEKAQQELNRQQ